LIRTGGFGKECCCRSGEKSLARALLYFDPRLLFTGQLVLTRRELLNGIRILSYHPLLTGVEFLDPFPQLGQIARYHLENLRLIERKRNCRPQRLATQSVANALAAKRWLPPHSAGRQTHCVARGAPIGPVAQMTSNRAAAAVGRQSASPY
jgi:hypothetical protein